MPYTLGQLRMLEDQCLSVSFLAKALKKSAKRGLKKEVGDPQSGFPP
jgi:hypothetical protein